MKILMVTRENQADKRYGLGKSLMPLIEELTHRGIQVGYLCQADVTDNNMTRLRVLHQWIVRLFGGFFRHTEFASLTWGILERLNMGRLAVKIMAQEHYTHVHCHDFIIAAGYHWFARWRWYLCLRRCHTARWGITGHSFGSYAQAFHEDGARLGTGVMRWLRSWETKMLLKAHWVITPTRSCLAQLARDLSVDPIPATWQVIYHPRPVLTVYAKTAARQRLGWTSSEIYLIAVGRLVKLKQFPLLIQACSYLKSSPWKLVLIGEGERDSLQTLAVKLGIAERLEFAITDDIGLYYSAADIYVSTSSTESFGLANLEALSMGLPTVCTAVGSVPEVLGSGSRLVPAQDLSALVYALQQLLDNAESRYYWAQQARHWAQRWPTITTIATAYLAIYESKPLPDFNQPPTLLDFPPPDWYQQIEQWQKYLSPQPLTLPQHAKILVIAPHADDETLGCGGTLARLQQQGCHIKVLIMTNGSQGDPLGYLNGDIVKIRQQESIAALNTLGINDIIFFDAPDGHFQSTPTLLNQLTAILNDFAADWLFLPSLLDYHHDHIVISLTLLTLWQQNGYKERLFLYEIWQLVPATWIVDITPVLPLKQAAMQCYQLPLKYKDYTTAFHGLMKYRGIYLEEPDKDAESFLELQANSWQSVVSHLFHLRKYQESVLT